VPGLLGGGEEPAPGLGGREAAQAEGAGGHGDGQIEGKERLPALGLAPDDADGLIGPEPIDEPAPRLGAGRQGLDVADGERAHRRPIAGRGAGALLGRGGAKTPRESFSSG
jgi:hypothetical protein